MSPTAQRILDPAAPPIAVHPGHIRDSPTNLSYNEKAFNTSEQTFDVTDNNGNVVLRATGKPFVFKDVKVITDVNGSTVFRIAASVQKTGQRAFTASDDAGKELFRAEKKWAWTAKIEVDFTNSITNNRNKLTIKGNSLGSSAEVTTEAGETIAIFTREFWSKQLLSNIKAYHLNIAPGVDVAFMTALCIVYDECKFDDAKRGGGS